MDEVPAKSFWTTFLIVEWEWSVSDKWMTQRKVSLSNIHHPAYCLLSFLSFIETKHRSRNKLKLREKRKECGFTSWILIEHSCLLISDIQRRKAFHLEESNIRLLWRIYESYTMIVMSCFWRAASDISRCDVKGRYFCHWIASS